MATVYLTRDLKHDRDVAIKVLKPDVTESLGRDRFVREIRLVACLQTHGSRANGHPHLHLLVTDGGCRPDGTVVSGPVNDTARLTGAFRRAVLRLFVRLELFDADQAAGMLMWPAFGVSRAYGRRGAGGCPGRCHPTRALLCAESRRAGAADQRLTYDWAAKAVTYRSDQSAGPTAAPRPSTHWSSSPGCWCTFPTRGTSPRGTTAGMRAFSLRSLSG